MFRFPMNSSIYGPGDDLLELSDASLETRLLFARRFDRERRGRRRLQRAQAGLVFAFLLTLALGGAIEWWLGSTTLGHVLIIGLVAIWTAGAAWYGNRKAKRLRQEFRAFVRDYCPDGKPRTCLHCDYDLRGSSGATCPECGVGVPRIVR